LPKNIFYFAIEQYLTLNLAHGMIGYKLNLEVVMTEGEYIREAKGYIEIRLKVGAGSLSSTGKSKVVATTGGFVVVADSDIKVSLNAIKPIR
jgi:hypothetical protein